VRERASALSPASTLILAIQHVLVMYAGAVAVPLIVGGAYALDKERLALLIDADLFACGIATLIQSLGLGPFGIRMPVVMGASFVCVAPILAAAHEPGATLGAAFGAVIVAGLFGLAIAPFAASLVRLFPPVVTGSVITVIGLSLLTVAVGWAGGGFGARNYGAPEHLAIAAFVLALIVLVTALGRGFVANIAVLLGIAVGYAVTLVLGRASVTGIGDAPWIALTTPLAYGLPSLSPALCIAMCLVMIVTMIESSGMFSALGEMTGETIDGPKLRRGLWADALGTLIGGLFNAFPYTSYSQNVGMIALSGVRSPVVTAVAGAILIGLGLVPKLGYLVASIPSSVLGGAGFVMFGMVTATGIGILGRAYGRGKHDAIIIALAIGLGLVPTLAPSFTNGLPPLLGALLGDGIIITAVVAVGLHALFSRDA
jgi:NCS2 family nucleobase:cation symporter-2